MEYRMKLYEDPFSKIKSGKKRIEVRLLDKKRQQIKLGDVITFSKLPNLQDQISVEVTGLHRYQSFQDLVSDFPMGSFGYPEDYSPTEFVKGCHEIYSPEQEGALGVLSIGIRLIDSF